MNIDRLMTQAGYDTEHMNDDDYNAMSDQFDEDKDSFIDAWLEKHGQEVAREYALRFTIPKVKE